VVAFAACAGAALAQQAALPPAPPQTFTTAVVRTTPLGHNIYMFDGMPGNIGGNVTLAVGADGAIMVDASYAEVADRLVPAMAAVSKVPTRYLIDTHYHGDHTGGNAVYAKAGAVIVAHDNVRARMDMATPNGNGGTRPAAPIEALPVITYPNTMTLRVDGQTAELFHMPPAHTDGDTYVYFRDADVLCTGDLFFSNRYPAIDVAAKGGIEGMIASAAVLLKLADDKTKIVPGHGPLADKTKLLEFRNMLISVRDRVKKRIAAGDSEDAVVAAKPLADLDAKWAPDPAQSERFLRIAYRSLKPQ
jgi:glyoxylase-like metal-dependent hydrolase (beta-lactamase superfamily II)